MRTFHTGDTKPNCQIQCNPLILDGVLHLQDGDCPFPAQRVPRTRLQTQTGDDVLAKHTQP